MKQTPTVAELLLCRNAFNILNMYTRPVRPTPQQPTLQLATNTHHAYLKSFSNKTLFHLNSFIISIAYKLENFTLFTFNTIIIVSGS